MPPDRSRGDGPKVFDGIAVSRETIADFQAYAALLGDWQRVKNLVSAGDFAQLWHRHFLDSYQLRMLFPDARRWLDLGSGAGFPGMVTALALKGQEGAHVTLVESNQRKVSFLREVARKLAAPATVRAERVDSVVKQWSGALDMISARAFAPLSELAAFSYPLIKTGARAAFHKGRDFSLELEEATKSWAFDLVEHPSVVSADSVIVEIRGLEPRIGAAR